MKRIISGIILAVMFFFGTAAQEINAAWQNQMIKTVESFPNKGGYYTGGKTTAKFPKTAWRGLSDCFVMGEKDARPITIDLWQAQPSFCSSATYVAILHALCEWDRNRVISRQAWVNLKPYVGIADNLNLEKFGQNDGQGCWGRGNANGPGVAVLIHDLNAGYSFTAFRGAKNPANKETEDEVYMSDEEWRSNPVWDRAVKGDLMKIFWDYNEKTGKDCGAIIGCNPDPNADQEHGHSVVFMGYDEYGNVLYWSSNGPGKEPEKNGYGISSCDKTEIQRVVFTRITNPENFNNAVNIPRDNYNEWLDALNGKYHGTTAELKSNCGIE